MRFRTESSRRYPVKTHTASGNKWKCRHRSGSRHIEPFKWVMTASRPWSIEPAMMWLWETRERIIKMSVHLSKQRVEQNEGICKCMVMRKGAASTAKWAAAHSRKAMEIAVKFRERVSVAVVVGMTAAAPWGLVRFKRFERLWWWPDPVFVISLCNSAP
jgi:hypothetical protein